MKHIRIPGMRIISSALIILLLAVMAVSCGGGKTDTSDVTTTAAAETEPAESTTAVDAMGDMDLGGKTFIIYDANDYPQNSMNLTREDKAGDLVNDALVERDIQITDRFNAVIEYIPGTSCATDCAAYKTSYMAGDHICDIIYSRLTGGGALTMLAEEKTLLDMADMPYLELNQPWWSRLMNESFTLGGKLYFTSGDIVTGMYLSQCVIGLNLNLLEQYQIKTDYFTLVREGRWVIDELIEIAKYKQDLDGDGVMHTSHDFFGLANDSTGYGLSAMAFVVGCGISSANNDGEHVTIDDIYSERMTDVVEKIRQVVIKDKFDDRRDYINLTFKSDRAIAVQTYIGTNLRDMESDFTYMPFPKYDEQQEDYRTMVNGWGTLFCGIAANTDPEFAGFMTEALTRYSYENVRPVMYDIVLKQKVARDENCTDMIDYVYDSIYFDLGTAYRFGGLEDIIGRSIYNGTELTSQIEAVREKALSEVEKFEAVWLS